jgi:hypothetical protein
VASALNRLSKHRRCSAPDFIPHKTRLIVRVIQSVLVLFAASLRSAEWTSKK